MGSTIGHLMAFVCELTFVAARGIEGIGLLAVATLLSSAYLVSAGLLREWQVYSEAYTANGPKSEFGGISQGCHDCIPKDAKAPWFRSTTAG